MTCNSTIGFILGSVLVLGSTACDRAAGIDIDDAQSGIYEVHTAVLEDTCAWQSEVADYPTAPWPGGVIVDKSDGHVGLPFAERHGVQRFDLSAEQEFAFEHSQRQECGSETQELRLIEMAADVVVAQRSLHWVVDTGCETELPVLPDATCSTRLEQVMYLQEPCEPPCAVRGVSDFACVCE